MLKEEEGIDQDIVNINSAKEKCDLYQSKYVDSYNELSANDTEQFCFGIHFTDKHFINMFRKKQNDYIDELEKRSGVTEPVWLPEMKDLPPEETIDLQLYRDLLQGGEWEIDLSNNPGFKEFKWSDE